MKKLTVKIFLVLVLGGISLTDALAESCVYSPDACGVALQSINSTFIGSISVPPGGTYSRDVDLSSCGGLIQNFHVVILNLRRRAPQATIQIFDETGGSVGSGSSSSLFIGTVSCSAKYHIEITSGAKKREEITLEWAGGM